MGALIDLNTTEEDESPSSAASSVSSSSASALTSSPSPSLTSSICLELWHACAGPLTSLPKKGNLVVYLPQGHLEQMQEFPATPSDLPPHILCRVIDVQLHQAEAGSDEVYAQVSLLPENEQMEHKMQEEMSNDIEEEDVEEGEKTTTPHMFCKTLTASDTSTHGGFSVPRRAAEDCFPPLDYNQQRPSQELVAKDLLGLKWKFRHIYRGQPRRHLLTTGWSAFVNKKRLVSGDAVLFLRGNDGELRLGIRRAAQLKSGSTFSNICSQKLNSSSIMDVVNAISSKSSFSVCYNPRATSSQFVLPFHKFLKSMNRSFSVGMRFRLSFETEDAADLRHTGHITGIGDVDPIGWPGSRWRSLMVRWDDGEINRHGRVSPWEIEPSGSVSMSSNLVPPGLKRSRIGLSSTKLEFPVPHGIGATDFGESLRFHKVLQGQEILGYNTPTDCDDNTRYHPPEKRRLLPDLHGSGIALMRNGPRNRLINSETSSRGFVFDESFQFQKVLQGQEIFPGPFYGRAMATNEVKESGGCGPVDGFRLSTTRDGWPTTMQCENFHTRSSIPSAQVSSPSSVFMFQQSMVPVLSFDSHNRGIMNKSTSHNSGTAFMTDNSMCPTSLGELNLLGLSHPSTTTASAFSGSKDLSSTTKAGCRLFGFSLTEEKNVGNTDKGSPATTPIHAGTTIGAQCPLKSPLMSKVVGSNCTKQERWDKKECHGLINLICIVMQGALQYHYANYSTYY
ncbi:auxin response factor 3-like isoform X1 [Cucurbita pepo subsp. pepo]|uniref:auxin response factor 3-like isoform X1 n=1 Tax=Cucurbita pepo subsp. pepo TaxID=3664 RepID=UPI000C9D9C9D|nr:auxin response factor 3-like isoform X1 [Cucurbita pepo subsp. pepo]XP_023544089.1 auxin response factor 3-like isoform X1 [Cucurbita pepo subsp. pepo]